jgi:Ran GTPase-activating protein (RanGAP) involved in mRNA processing and transport
MPSQAADAYLEACEANGVKPRAFLGEVLRAIEAEADGAGGRVGVVDLNGTLKPLFKSRLDGGEVVCFFDGLLQAAATRDRFDVAEINLSRNRIGADGAKKVAEFLAAPGVRLSALNLSDNEIDTGGIQSIVEALRSGAGGLVSLDISSNDIGAQGAMDVVTAVEENRTLWHLDLGRTGFDSSAIIALCDMLRHRRNTSLRSLGLSTPYVSKRSVPCATVVEHIGLMLKHNRGIQSLDLTGHRIDDRAAEVLCAYLCTTDSVERVVMPKNNIGFKGAAAFAAVLVDKNCNLRHLDLARNNVSDVGGVSLAQGLARNGTLETLDLAENDIADEGLLQLQQAATNHGSLRMLRLFTGNHFGRQAAGYAFEHPLGEEAEGGVQVDFKGFVVDGEVQIARVDLK